jgi:DNA mismatch endonuclease (patch repair protein)
MARKRLPAFDPPTAQRSENMRAIRSNANATTERRLVSMLLRARLGGWRLRAKELPGTPDFVFPQSRVVVFVDGCFFHGCPRCGHIPKTNRAYWRAKISRNRKRDRQMSRELRAAGYSVIRIRECELRKRPASCLKKISQRLKVASSASIAC